MAGLLRAAFAVSGGSPARTAAFRAGQNLHSGRSLAGCSPSARRSRRRPRARSLRRARRQDRAARASRRAPRNRGRRRPASPPAARDASAIEADRTCATFIWSNSTPPKTCPFATSFDRILVDAPCSGTGHPRAPPGNSLAASAGATARVSSLAGEYSFESAGQPCAGGKLVYSTCSLEPEENEEVVAEACAKTNLMRRVASFAVAASFEKLSRARNPAHETYWMIPGQFRTFPGEQATDGFFAAVLERQ